MFFSQKSSIRPVVEESPEFEILQNSQDKANIGKHRNNGGKYNQSGTEIDESHKTEVSSNENNPNEDNSYETEMEEIVTLRTF